MGQAREEMHEEEAMRETAKILVHMITLLARYPTASIGALHQLACAQMQEEEEDEELSRKMDKDD